MSLREIADIAGVSVSTVSRVINDTHRDKVGEQTRARILEIARSLHFRPNPQAVSLKTRRTFPTVGLMIPYFSHVLRGFYYSELSSGVLDAAYAHGVEVNLMVYRDASEETFREMLSTYRNVAGVIFVCVTSRLAAALEECRRGMLPCVVVNNNGSDPNVSSVNCDNRAGACTATRHLIRLGHVSIAHVAGRDFPDARERRQGYCEALAEAGLPIDERLIVCGDYEEAGGRAAMRTLLSRAPRPTAVFAANDLSAIGAMQAIRRAGLRIPDDIAVVGFDDISTAPYVEPPLTTVHQPIYRMGVRAAELLLAHFGEGNSRNGNTPDGNTPDGNTPDGNRRNGNGGVSEMPAVHEVLRTRLVVRESCGAQRTGWTMDGVDHE